jgi:hypothetical protein
VAELDIARWRRHGKDRLYVNASDGGLVGWIDLMTGERTLTDPARQESFTRAVNAWYVETAAHPQDVETAVSPALASPMLDAEAPTSRDEANQEAHPYPEAVVPEPAVPTWHDLATHVPGQAAREQAIRELAALKERTKVRTFIARVLDTKTDERAWRVGADGEETVGGRLEKLTKHGWHVLHAVPVGSHGTDIDHVVIGPGGVYTINTKRHPGGRIWVGAHAIRVNGQSVPYLRNARFEGGRAEKLLSQPAGFPVPVRPVLVLLTGTLIPNITIKQRPADVLILDRTDLPGAFKRAPTRMNADQVRAIYDYARRCTTWTRSARCSCSSPPP